MKVEYGNHGGQIYQERRKTLSGKQLNGGQNISGTLPKPHRYEIRQPDSGSRSRRAMRSGCSKVFMPRHITRKRKKSIHHKKSPLDDESVPYRHREGYTWANTTANVLMARWQRLPYIKHGDGRITITQPK